MIAENRIERVGVPQVEAAQMLGVSERTLRNWERRGIILGRKVGGFRMYPYQAIKELVEGQHNGESR